MNSRLSFIALLILLVTMVVNTTYSQNAVQATKVSIEIDAATRFHQIDGIGVNANTRSWNGSELEPAIDLLLDSMNATIWRVIVESVEKWEEVNDNDDPFTFNWDYYNKLYATPKFTKAWEMIRYLNRHGISDNVLINFMGFAPPWMGVKVIAPEYEDEFVEMIVSFFHYALKSEDLKFGLISPTNESEHHNYSEGPHLDAKQHARIIRKIIDRMEALGIMGNIRIVAPDNADTGKAIESFIPALMKDPVIVSRIAHYGIHSYGGYYKGLDDFFRNSPYPKSTWWVTEWNAWCNGCDDGKLGEYNYDFASRSVGFLLDLLRNGARAAIAWEGYDSYYEHHAPSLFSYWGFLAYDPLGKTYVPRKNFYAVQQVSRFVLPGSWRINIVSTADDLNVAAFHHSTTGKVSIVGINKENHPLELNALLKNLKGLSSMTLYYTDSIRNVHKEREVDMKGRSFRTIIPPNCIFTLTGIAK